MRGGKKHNQNGVVKCVCRSSNPKIPAERDYMRVSVSVSVNMSVSL